MTTTLQILSKTPTSISLRGTKNQTNSMAIAVGPGNNYEDIWANAAASQAVGSGQTGSFDVTFSSGLTSNTQYGAVAFLFGGGAGEVSSVLDGTLPSPALSSVSVNNLASNYVEMNFSMVADGGYYSRNVQYSLDNGSTWTTGYTASGGSAVSGQFITPLNLVANTAYTMETRVSTTAGNTTSPSVSFTTLAVAPTVTFAASTDTSATFNYSAAADGGASSKTIQYSLDGGTTWATAVTITSGAAASGTFTVSGLSASTDYTIQVRNSTTAGASTTTSVQFSTQQAPTPTKKLYGSVSGAAEPIIDLYGGSNSGAQRVTKLYGSVNETVLSEVTGTVRAGSSGISAGIAFDGEVFYNYVKNTIDLTKIPDYLFMHVGRFGETYTLTLYYSDGTFYAFENGSDRINPNLYGITWTEGPQYTGNDYIDLTPVYATNSVAKLIHQGFGHLNYS